VQIVVQGIPWAYTDDDLVALFQEVGTIEQASVVYSKDGRSRVRISALCASLCAVSRAAELLDEQMHAALASPLGPEWITGTCRV
jgi:hypothetical protein